MLRLPHYYWLISLPCHEHGEHLHRVSDRRRCLYWLFQARRQYGLSILNYAVTHSALLLVLADNGRGEIPCSLHFIATKFTREFKRRHRHLGALWASNYKAQRILNREEFYACTTTVDLSVVKQGLVSHPALWHQCGYFETQNPSKRSRRIDYRTLLQLSDCANLALMRAQHRQRVLEAVLIEGTSHLTTNERALTLGEKAAYQLLKPLGSAMQPAPA